jgi:hypothetical protein
MKRLLVIGLLAVAAATATSAPASASALCRNRIINQWEATGRIATTYPVSCYKQALAYARNIPDLEVYSSLPTDIRAAMAAAIARLHGKHVAASVGKPFRHTNSTLVSDSGKPSSRTGPSITRPTSLASGQTSGSGGSSIPVPLLVLGGLALLLAAAGTIGTIAKRRRS